MKRPMACDLVGLHTVKQNSRIYVHSDVNHGWHYPASPNNNVIEPNSESYNL